MAYIRDLDLEQARKALEKTLDVAQEAVFAGEISSRPVVFSLRKVGFLPPEDSTHPAQIQKWGLPEDLTLERAQWMLYGIRAVIVARNARGSWCNRGSNEALEDIGLERIHYQGREEQGDRPKNREGWD